ncbi:MAG: glycosyltransferase family 4 protein [bacterium]|nr:glycosyltransferase family 4 protein [bacterium]
MKILVVNWQDLAHPLSGGAEVHLHQFFSYFVEKGHSVTLLCSSYKGLSGFDEKDGIRIIRKGNRFLFNFLVPFYVRSLLKSEDFDVIVEDVNKIPFFLRFFVKKPIIVVTHHFFGKVIFQETNPLFGLYVYLFEKLFFKTYRRLPIITVSESTKEEMVKHGISDCSIKVVYNAVNLNFFRPGKKSEIPFILYLGRLKKYKRIDFFIKSIKVLRDEYYSGPLKVEIVGDGDARKGLEELVKKYGLSDVVKFTGYVSENVKSEKLRSAWLVINTSPKEGWGIVVMEAQASGTPVIVFDSPGLREAVKNNFSGFVVPFGNIDLVAQKAYEVISREDLRNRLSEGARKWAEEFDISVLREKFYSTFFEFLKS